MFGKKKKDGARNDEERVRSAGRAYYRQNDYYGQRPSQGNYYDSQDFEERYGERREYARPGYDSRYVNNSEGDPAAARQQRRQNAGAGENARRQMQQGRLPEYERRAGSVYGSPQEEYPENARRRQSAPYMEEGYGERIYDPAAYPGRSSERRRVRRNPQYEGSARERRYAGGAPRGDYGGRGARRGRKKKRRVWIFVLEILLVLILAVGVFAFSRLGKIGRFHLSDILQNEGIGSMSGYTNIALYGVDSRTGELTKDCHSDTIMILSINKRSKEIRIASVYRDTYLDNTNGEFRKATECYFYGGPERSVNMLNKNLDLNIKDYIAVNFNAVVDVIDVLGGIDLEITDEEMQYINGYCVENEQVTGVGYTPLSSSGYVHLDGIQALAYCRIRYTEGWDFKRTERQRTVLTLAFQKAVKMGPAALLSASNRLLPQISTSMGNVELISMVMAIGSYKAGEQTGFPFDMTPADLAVGDCIVPVNLAANVTRLHEFLFGETGYVPSSVVQEISNEIVSNTGIG